MMISRTTTGRSSMADLALTKSRRPEIQASPKHQGPVRTKENAQMRACTREWYGPGGAALGAWLRVGGRAGWGPMGMELSLANDGYRT